MAEFIKDPELRDVYNGVHRLAQTDPDNWTRIDKRDIVEAIEVLVWHIDQLKGANNG